ncbi:MAG: hypothetical protein ACK5O2_03485 [Microthrixaceae bacterium]
MRSHPVLAAFGLLGLLVTIVIMVMLGQKVLEGTSGGGEVPLLTVPTDLDPSAGTAPSDSQAGPPGGVASASAAQCATQRSAIELAIQAHELSGGAPATSLDEIVAQGLLVPPEGGLAFQLNPEGSLTGIGACAGL